MKQTDLFQSNAGTSPDNRPLALRMTPRTLAEYVGQDDILGPGKLLRRAIEADRLGSVIFHGPPGSGKSALARIIALTTKAHFEETNAVVAGIADIRKIIEQAKYRRDSSGEKTILLVDEIHHFNRSQQDALLPDVEKGIISLIGITTENPYFYVNQAIISRSVVFEFRAQSEDGLRLVLRRALEDKERGLGAYKVVMTPDAERHLIEQSGGDARRMLNALEIGVLSSAPGTDGVIRYDMSVAEESVQKRNIRYDKSSDEHYDHISAFIKSMRGSDPDAALYWMAKMLEAGEDPRFVARRVIICAAEDVGNADPRALMLSAAALQAVEFVGMPEGKIPLAQAVTYVATAPKSNAAYMALHRAEEEVRNGEPRPVPNHLKDPSMDGKTRGHGKGYRYPHDFPGHFIEQVYWPDPKVLYEPSDQGYETKIAERLSAWRKNRDAAAGAQHKGRTERT
jgi:putative ATPase